MKKKIIALILAIVTVLSVAVMPVQAQKIPTSQLLAKYIDGSYTMPSVADILKGLNTTGAIINKLFGTEVVDLSVLDITLDDTLNSVVKMVLDVSGVDFGEVFKLIPHSNRASEMLTGYSVDLGKLRGFVDNAANKAGAKNATVGLLMKLLAVSIGVMDRCDFVAVQDATDKDLYELVAKITYADGLTDDFNTGVYYNSKTQQFIGANGTPAILGFSMNIDEGTTYTGVYVWQRLFGFTFAYDLFCYLTPYLMQYRTQRFKFEYDNREWMIQIWKGRYFIANGGEVGIYTREKGSKGTFYYCASDEDMMYMDLRVYHGDNLLLTRERQLHWWVTGFNVSDTAYLPSTMTLVSTITMKDEEMLKAFKGALDKKSAVVDYEINGLDVTITW